MHFKKQMIWATSSIVVAMLLVLSSSVFGASSADLAGSSLALESEMQAAIWDGPAFDFLVGLAVGASVAALFRAYYIFTAPRRTAG